MRKSNIFKKQERLKLKQLIQEKTGYYIRSNNLFLQAFTRSSYSSANGGEDNEMLEFFGDQILSYYVIKIVAMRFGALNPDNEYSIRVREGRLTAIKQELVCNKALADIVDQWGIAEYLIVGKSDCENEIAKQVKVKADLFESVLGAIAVASEWDSAVLENAVSKMLSLDEKLDLMVKEDYSSTQFDLDNAVNTLKELAEHKRCSVPTYKYGSPDTLGYDEDGNPIWCCTCTVINESTGIIRQVWASSKRNAKRAAAYLVLCEHFQVQNKYGINGIKGKSIWKYENGKLNPSN